MEAQTTPTEPDRPKRLVRTKDDKVIAGVCGGLGRYFGVDPVLFRVGMIALVFLGGAGFVLYGVAWLLVPDEASGRSADAGYIARRVGLVLGVLALVVVVFVGGFWAAATGGGTVAAILVIVAGAVLVVGALRGGMRWLILPALSLALAVAIVSAADVKLDGGVGDVRLVVPDDVCVVTRAQIGAGGVDLFNRDHGGLDVDWENAPSAPAGTARLVVDADIGIGGLEVSHTDAGFHGPRPFDVDYGGDALGNAACTRASS